jgi:hypothetical protein
VFVGSEDRELYALDTTSCLQNSSALDLWETIWNLAVSSTSTLPEWGEVEVALAEWRSAKEVMDVAKAEWESANAEVEEAKRAEEAVKEKMTTAKRAEEVAKNTACEWVVRAQRAEEEVQGGEDRRGKRRCRQRRGGGGSSKRAMGKCCIFLERTTTDRLLALVPCGHQCVCAGCAERLVRKPCPICRKKLRQVLRLYPNAERE